MQDGKATFNMSRKRTAYIVTYGLLPKLVESGNLRAGMFQVVIADESHMLKNPEAARTIAALPLLQQAKRAVCLSGTPVLSRPAEIYTTLSALLPEVFASSDWLAFAERYCNLRHGPQGLDVSGAINTRELKLILESTIMIRRLKQVIIQ